MNNQIMTFEEFVKLYTNAPKEIQEAVARILDSVDSQNKDDVIIMKG